MRAKSAIAEILARRLRVSAGRVQGITQRLSDAGLVSRAEGDRSRPPDLDYSEITAMVLAVLADRGLGRVIESVKEFGDLPEGNGRRFFDALQSILSGCVDVATIVPGALVLRLNPASASLLTANGMQERFGPQPPDAAGRFVFLPGVVLAAVALEVQGRSAVEADIITERAAEAHAFAGQ